MDVMDYIKDLIPDIKLIILANLDAMDLSKIKIPQDHAEIIFKYRYGEYHTEVKNIIKINKELNFDDYTEESPYLWKILLKDQLLLETNPSFEFLACSYRIDYMNHESITIECMIKFYKSHPDIYIYMNKLLEHKCGIYLFYDAISFNDLGRIRHIGRVLTDRETIININTYFNGSKSDNRILIPIVIFIHFLRLYKRADQLIYNKLDLLSRLDRIVDDLQRHFYDESFYQRYELVINKYLGRI